MNHPGAARGPATFKAKDASGTARRLLSYFRPYRIRLFIALLTAILATMFTILAPKVLGEAITTMFEGVAAKFQGTGSGIDFDKIMQILLFLTALYLFSSVFGFVQQYVMAGVAQSMMYDLRMEVDKKLRRLPLRYYDGRTHGETLSRVTNDIDNISTTLQQSVTQFITSIVTIIGVLIMMLTISPTLTLITFLIIPLSLFVLRPILRKSQEYFSGQQRELGALNGHIEEMYTGHQIVKAFGYEETSQHQFDDVNERLYEQGRKAQFLSGMMMPLMFFINNLGYIAICVIGGVYVTQRMITIGDIQAFIQYSRQFTQPINQTANIANIVQLTLASAERVFELLDEEEEVNTVEEELPNVSGDVIFEHVKFGYVPGNTLINDLNVNVHAGQKVAIVGPTGAGKTTMINLLMRFYDVDGGRILIDGHDITDYTRSSVRKRFGMVLQDTWLYNGTIRDNIAYGRPDATDEEVHAAAKAALADYFIRTLPKGYDTLISDEGTALSQGQKQLLTIARALLADPNILILDEATSSVDTRTEVAIQRAMKRLMENRTSFVIAHRLSTIRDADLILVMNQGDVIESGTHEELIAADGFYADLYNSQFEGEAS